MRQRYLEEPGLVSGHDDEQETESREIPSSVLTTLLTNDQHERNRAMENDPMPSRSLYMITRVLYSDRYLDLCPSLWGLTTDNSIGHPPVLGAPGVLRYSARVGGCSKLW